MMRASIALPTLAVLALAADARAQEPSAPAAPTTSVVEVTAPEGWVLDAGRGAAQAAALRDGSHLGGGAVRTTAVGYRTPEPGALLLVSEVTAEPLPADPVAAARAELAALHGLVDAVGGTRVAWRFQGGDPLLPEARLEWKDPTVGTTSITRALVVRTAGALSVVTAECVIASHAEAQRAPCEAALASVKPAAAVARVEAGLGALDPATAPAAEPPPGATPTPGGRSLPTMREGPTEIPSTLLVRPPSTASQTDRRPLYLLGGVAVLALVFLWNRKQRAKLEAAEVRERRPRRRRNDDADARADADDDDDADVDTVHAAPERPRPPAPDDAQRRRGEQAPPTDAAIRPVPGAPTAPGDDDDDDDDVDEPDDEDLGKPSDGRPATGTPGGKEHA